MDFNAVVAKYFVGKTEIVSSKTISSHCGWKKSQPQCSGMTHFPFNV